MISAGDLVATGGLPKEAAPWSKDESLEDHRQHPHHTIKNWRSLQHHVNFHEIKHDGRSVEDVSEMHHLDHASGKIAADLGFGWLDDLSSLGFGPVEGF
jgi:hypothetical protein